MFSTKKLAIALTAVLALGAFGVQPVQADEWYNGKPAWAVYGLGAGLAVGHLATRHHYENDRDYRHHRRDNHYRDYRRYDRDYDRYDHYAYDRRPYYRTPSPDAYGYFGDQDGYYTYDEKRVWPFYKRIQAEFIPSLPAPPAAAPQAVSLAERSSEDAPAPVVININADNVSVDQPGNEYAPAVYEPVNRRPARVPVSNAAGSMFERADAQVNAGRYVDVELNDADATEMELGSLRAQIADLQEQLDRMENEQQDQQNEAEGEERKAAE